MLFDALWAPLFLLVLFLIHPLLGVVGACCVAFLFALTVAGELVTEDVLLRSGAALSQKLRPPPDCSEQHPHDPRHGNVR